MFPEVYYLTAVAVYV